MVVVAAGDWMRLFQGIMIQAPQMVQHHQEFHLRTLSLRGIGGRSLMKDSLHLEQWSQTLAR